ncbi:MAG: hypothetical protein ACFFDE_07740, partial [Promethearchaeota archaeon]
LEIHGYQTLIHRVLSMPQDIFYLMPNQIVIDNSLKKRLILIVAQLTTTLLSNENYGHPLTKR